MPNEGKRSRGPGYIAETVEVTHFDTDFVLISDLATNLDDNEVGKSLQVTSILLESKPWTIVQLAIAYMAINWPIRVNPFPFIVIKQCSAIASAPMARISP